MMDVAVYNERVMGPAHVDSITNRAVRFALSRRGVAHVTIPADFQEEPISAAKYSQNDQPNHTSTAFSSPSVLPQPVDLKAAAAVLNEGRKVAILIGSGARGARSEVGEIADILAAPVAKALLGKDVLPDDHPFVTGGIGPIGTTATHEAIEGCDTFLMIGSSFPYVSYYPKTDGSVRGVQIDLNPERIGLRFPVEVGLVGDAAETLRALIPLLGRKEDREFLTRVQQSMKEWRTLMEERAARTDLPMKPQVVARELSRQLAPDAILCGDSGTSALWTTATSNLAANSASPCRA
jgi:pyruvate dehydrogenase (quinone)